MVVQLQRFTLGELIDQAVMRYSSKKALIYEGSVMTYEQLGRNVNHLARGLMELGVAKGDKVGIWMVDNYAWVYSYFAITKIGAIAVPINARYRIHDAKYILSHAEITALIISDLKPEVQNYVGMMYQLCPEIREFKSGPMDLKDFRRLRYVLTVGPRSHDGMLTIDRVMDMGMKVPDNDLRSRYPVEPEDIAVLQYTSGTTSFPKGCVITQDIVVRNSLACALRLEIEESGDVFCDVMPPYHVIGITFGIVPSIAYGCCRVGMDHFDPLEVFKVVEKEKCTVHSGMADMIKAKLDHPEFRKYDLTSLRKGICGDSPTVFQRVHEVLPNWKIVGLYGLSEVGGNLCTGKRSDSLETRMYTHGTPHESLEIKITDPETGKSLPRNVQGELCASGWTIMKGYYKDPEATKKTIDQDGWLHTGDRACIDQDGQLRWAGRIKDVIKVGGENVSPKEVEDYLIQHPKVQYVQAVGVSDPKLIEVVAAFVELKKGEKCTEDEIIQFCKGKIASFKIPKYVRFVESWPMSATKVQKHKLRDQLEQEFQKAKRS